MTLLYDDGLDTFLGNKRCVIKLDHDDIGHGVRHDKLYRLLLNDSSESSNVCDVINKHETSSKLWHCRLGHISKGRMERLIKEEILHPLDFSDLDHCIDCIKGKFVKQIKKEAIRSSGVLELIHTDICGPFPITSADGYDSFITFTDDYSRYGYIFPIRERSEALDKFKIYKAEVENQHNLKIKVVRSDRGGEYYGRMQLMDKFLAPLLYFFKKME